MDYSPIRPRISQFFLTLENHCASSNNPYARSLSLTENSNATFVKHNKYLKAVNSTWKLFGNRSQGI